MAGRRRPAVWAATRFTGPCTTRNSATRCCRYRRNTGHSRPSAPPCLNSLPAWPPPTCPATSAARNGGARASPNRSRAATWPRCAPAQSPTATGGFVVNGQKIWTSQGPTATRLLALVRTGTPESRHRGLTMIMVDADAPGVTIRPIALASGRRELAEVFFDDVARRPRTGDRRRRRRLGGGDAPHAVRTRHVRLRRA